MTSARLFFTSLDADKRSNLWVTDGTAAGTRQVSATGGPRGLAPSSFAVLGNSAYFQGVNAAVKAGLFKLDGASGAVSEITPANVSAQGLFPVSLKAYAGKLYFGGYNAANANVLWTSDGTAAGTAEAPLFGQGAAGLRPGSFTPFAGRLALAASSASAADGLYLSDGTAAGTKKVGINGAPPSPDIVSMASLGSKLVFGTLDAPPRNQLWVSDGTTAGTNELAVSGLNPDTYYNGFPAGLLSFGSKAGFTAADASGKYGVWITDGTAAGTVELPGVRGESIGVPMAALSGGRLAFIAADANGISRVWITDGTAAGTAALPVPEGALEPYLLPHAVMTMGNLVLFDGVLVPSRTRCLFASDGTAAGTRLIQTGINLVPRIDTDAALLPGTLTLAPAALPTVAAGGAVAVSSASAGLPGDLLTVALLSDPAPSGSSVRINAQGTILYQPGPVGAAQAGEGLVRYAVTDAVTHETVSATQRVMLLGSDPLLDPAYYLQHNPDVAAAGANPLLHYLSYGWKEGRDPCAFFDTNYYLQQNPDVAAAGVNPLLHFEAHGWKEGRQPSLVFDDAKYLAANPDVAAAGANPLQHFMAYGRGEGRASFLTGGAAAADPLVDTAYYDRQLGATLIPGGPAGAQQAAYSYDATGWRKGLNPDAWFDTRYYLARNPDVAAAQVNPLLHYETYGWKEGRDPSTAFSTGKYLAAYADVKAAGLDPLLHYVAYGQAEGRSPLG